MAVKTKKVGSMGRYGPRVGRKTRKRALTIENLKRSMKVCPYCGKKGVKRKAAGIWFCKNCDTVFSGGTHLPRSMKR